MDLRARRARGARGAAVAALVLAPLGGVVAAAGTALPALAAPKPPTPGPDGPAVPGPKPPKAEEKPPKPEEKPDTKAPGVPQVGEPVVEAGGAVTVTVRAEKASDVVIREQGEVVASGTARGGSVTLDWTTTTGEHSYVVRATDEAGNTSDPARFTVEADADAPPIRRVEWKAGTASDTRSRVTFRTEPDAAYRVLVDGEVVAEGTAEGRPVAHRLDVADGRHQAVVEVTDEVGNVATDDRPFVVRIGALAVRTQLTSEPTVARQVIRIAATPTATKGTVRVPGAEDTPFTLKNGRATVRLQLAEGTYDAVQVSLRDTQGRRGRTVVDEFVVDTSAPTVAITTDDAAAAKGKLEAAITAEEGAEVTWRILDSTGVVLDSGTFTADGGPERITRDVEEGEARLSVEATDEYDRTTTDAVTADIAKDPWPVALIVAVGVAAAVAGIALVFALVWLLRRLWLAVRPRVVARREERRIVAAQAVAQQEHEERRLATLREWEARSAVVGTFLEGVTDGWDVGAVPGLVLQDGEQVRHMAVATLYDASAGSEDLELVGHAGALVVTGDRLVFLGEHGQEWSRDDLGALSHVGEDRTMLQHAGDADDWTGLVYEEPEVTRLHLDLMLAEQQGRGDEFVAARRDELAMPEDDDTKVDLSAWV